VKAPCLRPQEVGQVEQPQQQGERRVAAVCRGCHGQRDQRMDGRLVAPAAAVVGRADATCVSRAGEEEAGLKAAEEGGGARQRRE